jgi:hypothetical protein
MYALFFALGMLITGTLNTLTRKLQNDTKAKGVDGTVHLFRHPFFQTFVMFIGTNHKTQNEFHLVTKV